MPFKIPENISKSLYFSWFSGATEWGSVVAKRFCGEGGRLKKLALEDICHSVGFLKSRQGKKEGGGNKNITVLWGVMLLLS